MPRTYHHHVSGQVWYMGIENIRIAKKGTELFLLEISCDSYLANLSPEQR